VVDTGIWRNVPFPFSILMEVYKMSLRTLEEGIQTILYCALSPDLEGVTGRYYRNCKEGKPVSGVYDEKWQSIMWEESKKMVKLTGNDPKI
jgi:hypothetical protein